MIINQEMIHSIASQICKKHGLIESDDIEDVIDYALDLLPKEFSTTELRQTLNDVCEDFIDSIEMD